MRNKKYDEIDKQKVEELTKKQVKSIGVNLRRIRLSEKLTQGEVAFYIFADKSFIWKLERGFLENITLESVNKLCELFKIKFEDLLTNIETKDE